eukprot:567447-Amphidinium_carterae.1
MFHVQLPWNLNKLMTNTSWTDLGGSGEEAIARRKSATTKLSLKGDLLHFVRDDGAELIESTHAHDINKLMPVQMTILQTQYCTHGVADDAEEPTSTAQMLMKKTLLPKQSCGERVAAARTLASSCALKTECCVVDKHWVHALIISAMHRYNCDRGPTWRVKLLNC